MVKLNELLLDTNFIIECGKRRLLDKAREKTPGAKMITLEAVVEELRKQGEELALAIIESEGIRVLPIVGYADNAILEYAARGKVAVATNDKGLTEKLRGMKVPVVFPTADGCEIIGGIV